MWKLRSQWAKQQTGGNWHQTQVQLPPQKTVEPDRVLSERPYSACQPQKWKTTPWQETAACPGMEGTHWVTLDGSCCQQGIWLGGPGAWRQCTCVSTVTGADRDTHGELRPQHRLAKVRFRPAAESLSLDWSTEGRGDQCWLQSAVPFPSPFPQSPAFVSFRGCTGALRHRNKSNVPPGHCHLLGFHTFRVSGGRETLPFSQCLWCAPVAPPRAWDSLCCWVVTGLWSGRRWGARSSWKGN